MRDAAIAKRGPAGQVHQVFHVCGTHHSLVEHGDVLEEFVEFHVLLGEGADQIVIVHAGDRQHRLAVQLGVVEAVEQMNAAGAGCAEADAQLAGVFGVGAGHEGRRLFVTHLDEADLVLAGAQGLHDSVDAVAGKSEDRVHAPIV